MLSNLHRAYVYALTLLFAPGCGTIVGNPKKPKDPNQPAPTGLVYALPELDFDVGDVAGDTDTASELMLVQDDPAEGDRSLLHAWGRRFAKVVMDINGLSRRVNKIVEEERAAGNDDENLVFKDKGTLHKLSGKVLPLADGGVYAYEAVICYEGKVFNHLKWSEDGGKVELTRDFAPKIADEDESYSVVSKIVATKGDSGAAKLEVLMNGQWDAMAQDGEDGKGVAEHGVVNRLASGELQVSSVVDRFAEKPADGAYEGDAYLVGRLVPGTATDAGKKHFDAEFLGYYDVLPRCASTAFDEADPKFCVGRPLGKKRFTSLAQYKATVETLKGIPVQSRKSLVGVALDASLSCEP